MSQSDSDTPRFKVLIADDNPQILELLEAYLEPLGVDVRLAADGEATLAAVERDEPDLILLDIMMPKRSGFEVCRLLKDDPRYRDIAIIMVTALNEMGDLERARECGSDDFLSKPVNKIELLARVQNLLKLRQLKRAAGRRGAEPPPAE
ncbi:MAG: response regulator [Phycisphaerae bacterium]|jgi:CheY-like chemotaxis protein|nr:response regulator [Phycisphaerae bacterium]HQL53263.1 response regulator [Phycisphaerae bacterium]